jgi:hypothetical protein
MQEERTDEASLQDAAPLGRCTFNQDGNTVSLNCISEAECHEQVQELQGEFISWTPDPDCD